MTIERILSKTQKRTVLALHSDRQRLIAELGECDAALEDLAVVYRAAHELPEGEYRFQGDGNEIRIVRVEKPAEATGGEPVAVVAEVAAEEESAENDGTD